MKEILLEEFDEFIETESLDLYLLREGNYYCILDERTYFILGDMIFSSGEIIILKTTLKLVEFLLYLGEI